MKTPHSKTRILYLSYDGLTDALGQSQILPYLAGLADEGYSITIVSFEKPDRYQTFGGEICKVCDEHRLIWKPLKYHKLPPVISTVYDLIALRRTVKKLLRQHKFTIIHCRSYLTSLIGLWARRKFPVKFLFDMRGFWADERVEGGLWNLNNPLFRFIYNFFKNREKAFIDGADHIITLTENAKREILSWQSPNAPISVIPTCVDMDLFDPDRYDKSGVAKNNLSIEADSFVLLYLGSWGTWYMTEDILRLFSSLVTKNSKSTLLIVSPDSPDLKDYPFRSRVVIRNARRTEVPLLLSIANATVCFIKPVFSKKASSATKIAEAWAMNLPVVTNPGWGDIDDLHKDGMPLLLCASPTEYDSVASLLLQQKAGHYRNKLLGTFDLRSAVRKYKSIYRSLCAT